MSDSRSPVGIAVDAMGGDSGPSVVVRGAVNYLRETGRADTIILVGDSGRIYPELKKLGAGKMDNPPRVVHTTEEIGMKDDAASSFRRKKDSSIARGLMLQKEGEVSAFVSAGNTGAVVACSLIALGRLPGVRRPAIATMVPGAKGGYLLLDVGATKDCRPTDLVQFAQMGSIYAERLLDRPSPRVGLLNIGEEESKGNELTREANELLRESGLRFVGNVEPNGLFRAEADVAVCDGFTGNVALKFAESVFERITVLVRGEIRHRPLAKIGAFLLTPVIATLKKQLSYEQYGGAPLLGIDGITIICHGRSSPLAISNAIRTASRFVRYNINAEIKKKLEAYQEVTVE